MAQLKGNLGIRMFTTGQQYRLHPTRLQDREDLRINNDRMGGHGVCRKGEIEVSCAELIENPEEIGNRHTQREVGNWENDAYRANCGDQTTDVRYAGVAIDSQSGLDWGEIENYGTDIEVGDYLLNRDGACDYG